MSTKTILRRVAAILVASTSKTHGYVEITPDR